MKAPLLIIAVIALTGCTSITTPEGAKYRNAFFAKQIGDLEIEKQSGTNYTRVKIKSVKSSGQEVADVFKEGFQQGINGLRVYTGQGGSVQNAPAAPTQEQVNEAVRLYQIKAANSTVTAPSK
jgi:hypothetical protein